MNKADIKNNAKKIIDEAYAKISELEGKRDQITGELKSEFDDKIKLLKAKGEDLKLKISSLEDEGEDKWDEVKDVLADSMDSFKEGFAKLGKLFFESWFNYKDHKGRRCPASSEAGLGAFFHFRF